MLKYGLIIEFIKSKNGATEKEIKDAKLTSDPKGFIRIMRMYGAITLGEDGKLRVLDEEKASTFSTLGKRAFKNAEINSEEMPILFYPNPICLSKILSNLIDTYHLDVQNNLVLLTKHNSEIIERLVQNDPSYKPRAKELFLSHLDSNGNFIKNKDNVLEVAKKINTDNSTRLSNADVEKIVDFILDESSNFFSNIENGIIDPKMPDRIRNHINGRSYGPKSFVSKVVKYFDEFYHYNVENYQNGYFINDSFVRAVMPYYFKHYGVNLERIAHYNKHKTEYLRYEDLFNLLENLRLKSENLTRSELDHILWYCYKSYDNGTVYLGNSKAEEDIK